MALLLALRKAGFEPAQSLPSQGSGFTKVCPLTLCWRQDSNLHAKDAGF